MTTNSDRTTLVCLFHHTDHAQGAIRELQEAGISLSDITVIGNGGTASMPSALAALKVPERDVTHLMDGVNDGGTVVGVTAADELAERVQDIFERHSAAKIDEAELNAVAAAEPPAAREVDGSMAIPVVEESLVVGKRQVDAGGVRVIRRMVEEPVAEEVELREEKVTVTRRPTDRVASAGDLASGNERNLELVGTREEAVVSKTARVVEEISLSKEATERTERVTDTVRSTEVEIETLKDGKGRK